MVVTVLILALAALAMSYVAVAGVCQLSSERMLDIPNSRSSHMRPTTRGGGLAIVLCAFGGLGIFYVYRAANIPINCIIAFYVSGSLIALIGWLDDLYSLQSWVRLLVQALSAAFILIAVGYWNALSFPIFGTVRLNWIGIPITLFWIIGLTNAYNFMDGIDGIAGGQAVVAGLGWAVAGWISNLPLVHVLGILIAASSIGFLFHNWPPARVFMGDVGSAFIGFTLAFLPIVAAKNDSRLPFVGMLMVWPFMLDTTYTLLRRIKRGENILEAHRSHIYQRLVIAGYSHRFVTLIYVSLASIGTVIALLWYKRVPFVSVVAILLPILLFAGLWRFTARAETRVHPVT